MPPPNFLKPVVQSVHRKPQREPITVVPRAISMRLGHEGACDGLDVVITSAHVTFEIVARVLLHGSMHRCAMGQCYENEQLGMTEGAIRCYRRAAENGDREGAS